MVTSDAPLGLCLHRHLMIKIWKTEIPISWLHEIYIKTHINPYYDSNAGKKNHMKRLLRESEGQHIYSAAEWHSHEK